MNVIIASAARDVAGAWQYGQVELVEWMEFRGRDLAEHAVPPNLGILALRIPVADLEYWQARLAAHGVSTFMGPASRARITESIIMTMTASRFVLAALVLALSLPGTAAADDAATSCAALAAPGIAVRFGQIVDAPTTVESARVLPAERDLPEICRVEGRIAPQVGFLLRMPTSGWNGKLMMGGCGGPCGNYMVDRIDPALVRGYAVVTTDMGHKGSGWMWAWNNLEAQLDFGYRATHLTAVVAKTLINAYYGRPTARNYFWGCSTGGRQAMVSAQRFPTDFEGIVAGAPVWSQTGNHPFFTHWGARVNIGKDGRPILDAAKLPMIHDAVLAACDARDGLRDGILQDPRQCDWDPESFRCGAALQSRSDAGAERCLTGEEAGVVRRIYEGARNSKGELLYAGMVRGSEDQWAGIWINGGGQPGLLLGGPGFIANSVTAYMTFMRDGGPGYSVFRDFDYDRDPPRLALTEGFFSPQQHDLRPFKAAGGKLLLWTGWNDNNIPPAAAIDYYETTTRTMGGAAETRDFFRMFMLPAVNHCSGGHVIHGLRSPSARSGQLRSSAPCIRLPGRRALWRQGRSCLAGKLATGERARTRTRTRCGALTASPR